jgi:hypothetical protein
MYYPMHASTSCPYDTAVHPHLDLPVERICGQRPAAAARGGTVCTITAMPTSPLSRASSILGAAIMRHWGG